MLEQSGLIQEWRMLRVLLANATGEIGGAEQVLLALATRLPAHGVDVSVALLRPGPLQVTLERHGVRTYVFGESYRYRDLLSVWRGIRWLTEVARADSCQILHSNLTAHFMGTWAAHFAGIPEVWHLHDYPFTFESVHFLSRFFPADFHIFTTEYLKTGEPSLARRPHAVINPDCVDPEQLQAMPHSETVYGKYGIRPGEYFLTVTRMQPHKGHAYLLEAIHQLVSLYPQLRWVIAGKAKGLEQDKYLADLKRQLVQLGTEDRVVFAGFIEENDMASLFRGAIAVVHSAVTEGYGLVLLEAMAHGVPVIAAAAAGPSEIIENEKNGLLVPVQNATALAKAMRRILDEPALADQLRSQGRISVQQRSIAMMVERTAEVYRQVLGVDYGNS